MIQFEEKKITILEPSSETIQARIIKYAGSAKRSPIDYGLVATGKKRIIHWREVASPPEASART